MRLYQVRGCPYAHRARIVLEEKRLAYEVVYFEPRNRPPELVELSDAARSPTLFDDEKGARIWDSVVVSEYLDERHPEAPVMPRDTAERAHVRLLMREVEGRLGRALAPLEAEVVHKAAEHRDDEKVRRAIADYQGELVHWNARIGGGPFLAGEMFTLADILLFTPLFAMESLLEKNGRIPDELTQLREWRVRVGARPSTAYP